MVRINKLSKLKIELKELKKLFPKKVPPKRPAWKTSSDELIGSRNNWVEFANALTCDIRGVVVLLRNNIVVLFRDVDSWIKSVENSGGREREVAMSCILGEWILCDFYPFLFCLWGLFRMIFLPKVGRCIKAGMGFDSDKTSLINFIHLFRRYLLTFNAGLLKAKSGNEEWARMEKKWLKKIKKKTTPGAWLSQYKEVSGKKSSIC